MKGWKQEAYRIKEGWWNVYREKKLALGLNVLKKTTDLIQWY